MDIMGQKREETKKEFLALKPLERIQRMNTVINDIISFKAKTAGVREYEVYRRYLKPRIACPKRVNTEENDGDLLISG